jgi:hypothetical protein
MKTTNAEQNASVTPKTTKRKRCPSPTTRKKNKKSKHQSVQILETPNAQESHDADVDEPYDYTQAYVNEVTSLGEGPQELPKHAVSRNLPPKRFYAETLRRMARTLGRPTATTSVSLTELDMAFRALYGPPTRESMRRCADIIFRVDGTQRPNLFLCLPVELTDIILIMAGEPDKLRAVCRQWRDIVQGDCNAWDKHIRELIMLANLALLKTLPRESSPASWPALFAYGHDEEGEYVRMESLMFDDFRKSFIRITEESIDQLDWLDDDKFVKEIDELSPPFGRITPAEAFRWVKKCRMGDGGSTMEMEIRAMPRMFRQVPRKVLPFLLEMTEEQKENWIASSSPFSQICTCDGGIGRHGWDYDIPSFEVAHRAEKIYYRPDVWAEMVLFVEKAFFTQNVCKQPRAPESAAFRLLPFPPSLPPSVEALVLAKKSE